MRYLMGFMVLALAVALAVPAFAETQNVKVSGEVTSMFIARDQISAADTFDESSDSASDNFFLSKAAVQIDADLTDNVSTVIRMAYQRDWDDANDSSSEFDVDVDLAYVVLKEMIYAPLTLTIGRQDLVFGNAFIMGANYNDPNSSIGADEFTEFLAFDAIRATLDYDPWTIDLVYSKIDEGALDKMDDVDVYGINVGYMFDSYNAEAEAYYWFRNDSNAFGIAGASDPDTLNIIGARGSMDIIENLTGAAEVAYQFGDYMDTTNGAKRDRKAWAANVMADYVWQDINWMPMLGGQYVYFSGNSVSNTSGDYEGWNSFYRDTTYGDIAEWIGSYYKTATYSTGADSIIGNNSNRHIFNIYGSVEPMENVMINAKYYHFLLDESISATNTSKDLGDEVDVRVTYNYTDDVTFDLLGSIFWPGDTYPNGQDDTATQLIGTVKVEF